MEKNNFQIILYAVFGILALAGFVSVSLYGFLKKEEGDRAPENVKPNIVLWGTVNEEEMRPVIRRINRSESAGHGTITYREKNPITVREEYRDAIVLGKPPDLLLLDHETLFSVQVTLQTIPFSFFPLSEYQNRFIEPAGMFRVRGGYIALPFLSDAMVLYYNENLRLWLKNHIRKAPDTWDDLVGERYIEVAKRYRESDRTLIPFGAYGNYKNAVDVFSALMLQARESEEGLTGESARNILEFYAAFANPNASVYSWSVALPDARDMFIGNRLLYYPGYNSEYADLRRANPNLVVRASPLPQRADGATVTNARLYAFAVPKASKAQVAAVAAAKTLIGVFYEYSETDGTLRPRPSSDLTKIFSLQPAIQGYYPDENATSLQKVFIDSLFSARSARLTPEERGEIKRTLRNVVTGSQGVEKGAETMLNIFK